MSKPTKGHAPRQFQNRNSLKHSDVTLQTVLTLGDYKILTNAMIRRLRDYIDEEFYKREEYARQQKWYRRLARAFTRKKLVNQTSAAVEEIVGNGEELAE